MRSELTRRSFLGRTLGGAGLAILANARSARTFEANEKLDIALVGIGGRGTWFVDTIPKMENVVAVCDVNDDRAAESYKKLPDVPRFADYRRMLEEKEREIDAVIVAAPDHHHAPCSVRAMRRGKHVYCEKPLTNTVAESRVLRETARSCKVATQMGNQGTASGPFREAVEVIRSGGIGEVREVHVWNDAGGPDHAEKPRGSEPVPKHLEWNLWLGPAEDRAFHPLWLQWHGWRDFGTGNIGNWASHTANLAFMALRVDALWHREPLALPEDAAAPSVKEAGQTLRVEAKVSQRNRLAFPRWETIRWDVPARPGFPPVSIHWHNGSGAPGSRKLIEELMGEGIDWGDKKEKKWADFAGALIVGTKGKLHATGHNATYRLLPQDDFKGYDPPKPTTLPRSPGHEREWLDACRGGPPAMSSFDYSGPLEEFLLLGNVATQFEGTLEFDPGECKVIGHAEADRALRREYRKGWEL